jgi:hypothetical protein
VRAVRVVPHAFVLVRLQNDNGLMENDFYKVEVDKSSGAVSLTDKKRGKVPCRASLPRRAGGWEQLAHT